MMMMTMIMRIMMVMIVTSYFASITLQNLQKYAKTKVTIEGLVLSCLNAKVRIPIICFNICLLPCVWLWVFLAVLACISPTQSDARGPTLAHPSLNCPLYFQPTNPSLPGALLCICEFVYLHICLVSSFVFAQHCSWRLKFALLERGPAICS